MGILNAWRVVEATADEVKATVYPYTPPQYGNTPNFYGGSLPVFVTRDQAMSVPAVARARNIIAGTIGTLPLEEYNSQDQEISPRKVIEQPDPAVPRTTTITWLVDDLMFYGVGYLQVIDVSPADGRPYRLRRINPQRVSYNLSVDRTEIVSYNLDTNLLPNDGLGSLIVFQGLDEGILNRAGQTIKTAIELEAAAYRMAQEPAPQIVLRNRSMNLPSDQVASLLSSWKLARQTRSTAYAEGDMEIDKIGFDSAQMQLVEARQHLASEIARCTNIPAWYLNAESASSTYSNVSQERRSLVDFGLRPFLAIIEDRLSMDDVTPRGQRVRFDVDDFLRGNPSEQADIAIKLAQAGIITINEARDLVDYAPSTPITPGAPENESA